MSPKLGDGVRSRHRLPTAVIVPHTVRVYQRSPSPTTAPARSTFGSRGCPRCPECCSLPRLRVARSLGGAGPQTARAGSRLCGFDVDWAENCSAKPRKFDTLRLISPVMASELPPNTRCAVHGNLRATHTCGICESHVCPHCMPNGLDPGQICIVCDAKLALRSASATRWYVRVLVSLLVLQIVALLADCVFHYAFVGASARVDGGGMTDTELSWWQSTSEQLYFIWGGLFLLTGIVWIAWHKRTNRALRARRIELEYGPLGWIWYFVPVANLYLPYVATKEMFFKATNKLEIPGVFLWWWLCWLSASFVGRMVEAVADRAAPADEFSAIHLGNVQNLLLIASAVAAIMLLRTIQREIDRAASVRARRLDPSTWDDGYRQLPLEPAAPEQDLWAVGSAPSDRDG